MTFLRRLVAAGWVAASLVSFLGCSSQVSVVRRDDGVIHVKCKDLALPYCLLKAEDACEHERYIVLRAFDDHDHGPRSDAPIEVRDSEAYVVCGLHHSWGPKLATLRQEPITTIPKCAPASDVPAPPASPAAPARACTPGASYACVGAGGCKGGQACLPDGSALGPCDCGPAAPPSP
jgi:hypothetical protein